MLLLVTLILASIIPSWAADDAALISKLPGLSVVPKFRQYSGYLRASQTHQLHYWFVESQSDPRADPLVVWYNGGPGCSSLDGFLSEHGPFRLQDNLSLTINPHSWNKRANMLYIESPAGVGYSFSTNGNVTTNDIQVATENHEALKDFLLKFPEFRHNEFFVTGESYGGVYIPSLTVLLLNDTSFNLKGIAVGNGLSSYLYNENSLIYFAYYHGLFGTPLWIDLHKNCNCNHKHPCFFTSHADQSVACRISLSVATTALDDLDVYNLYGPCYHPKKTKISKRIAKLFRSKSFAKLKDVPDCTNSTAATLYLNQANVRQALHIPSFVQPWMICSDKVEAHYGRNFMDMSAQYHRILSSKTRVLIYNGDIDMACNFLGDEWFFDHLNYRMDYSRQKWFLPSDIGIQVGGVSKSFLQGQLLFTTVRGAGHMVPTDRPIAAYHMIDRFLRNKPL